MLVLLLFVLFLLDMAFYWLALIILILIFGSAINSEEEVSFVSAYILKSKYCLHLLFQGFLSIISVVSLI